jgi:hypothetical protein
MQLSRDNTLQRTVQLIQRNSALLNGLQHTLAFGSFEKTFN